MNLIGFKVLMLSIICCIYADKLTKNSLKGALNIFEQETLLEKFFASPLQDVDDHLVIIFHCEFSSERAPKMFEDDV